MAIKGKKKRRSSGPARRPQNAPRPAVAQKRPPTWYNSPTGMMVAGVVTAGVVVLIVYLVIHAVSSSGNDTQVASKNQLTTFSTSLTSLKQAASDPVLGMVDVQGKNPDLSHLSDEAARWVQTLQQLEGTVSNQSTPAALQPVNGVFASAITEYQNAASAYMLAAKMPKAQQAAGIAVAKAERLQGDSLWDTGIALLDQQRTAAGMSQFQVPTPSTPPAKG